MVLYSYRPAMPTLQVETQKVVLDKGGPIQVHLNISLPGNFRFILPYEDIDILQVRTSYQHSNHSELVDSQLT